MSDAPMVSVVVPMLDEIEHIERCVAGFEAQTHPAERLEVLVVDGGSADGSTAVVERLASTRPWLRLVANPDRRASSAFNRGIEAAKGDVVCLVAAHGEVGPDFVERSVRALDETGAAGVGGVLRHEGTDPASMAIGLAMTSPFGMASPFRYASSRRAVDTIGHPAYRKAALDEVGPFDERLERNSDYELNYRLRALGHELVFDPDIVTVYRPRTSLGRLGRQFWSYGRWKAHVVRRHPRSVRPRHLVPPAFVVALASAPALMGSTGGRKLVATGAIGYAAVLATAVATSRPRRAGARADVFVAALPVMHASWGAGFLATIVRGWR